MKAAVLKKYGEISDVIKIMDVDKPRPKANEVLIKVKASSVNDWDWGLIRAKPFYMRLICGLIKPKITIPGVDVSGTIEAVGTDVTKFKKGDRVYGDLSESGFGAFAEFVCADEAAIEKMSDKMTFEDAAALPHASMLAYQGIVDLGELQVDQRLLINGAGGGVGTIAVQLAKMIGLNKITGVDHSDKFETMRSSGFTDLIDYTKEDFTLINKKYDLILDAKTTRSGLSYLRVLNENGKYITVGGKISKFIGFLFYNLFTKKKLKVLALKTNKDLVLINELYEKKLITPIIGSIFKFSEIKEAIQLFGEAKHQGKVIIQF